MIRQHFSEAGITIHTPIYTIHPVLCQFIRLPFRNHPKSHYIYEENTGVMKLPQYTRKDMLIMGTVLPILVMFIDFMLFGTVIFTEVRNFLIASGAVLIIFVPGWILFTWVAVTVRERFPANRDTLKRIGLTLVIIVLLMAGINSIIFLGFDFFGILDYQLNQSRYGMTVLTFFFINVTITLTHEGFDSFEKWKSTFNDAEKLKTAYARSQLLGLQSQLNPHFLFNSLNSLSSLIAEDEEKAESFLNELTKVSRYFLKDKEEQLVSLNEELQFIRSWFYLMQARYGDGIQLEIAERQNGTNYLIPPLSVQAWLEYVISTNSIGKESPLKIHLSLTGDGWLQVMNNVQKKSLSTPMISPAVQNLKDKFNLLTQQEVIIREENKICLLQLPIIGSHTTDVA